MSNICWHSGPPPSFHPLCLPSSVPWIHRAPFPISAPDTVSECTKGAQYHSCPPLYQRAYVSIHFSDSACRYAFYEHSKWATALGFRIKAHYHLYYYGCLHIARMLIVNDDQWPLKLLYLTQYWPLNHELLLQYLFPRTTTIGLWQRGWWWEIYVFLLIVGVFFFPLPRIFWESLQY